MITLSVPSASCINGSNPLDATWVSSDIEVKTSRILPHAFRVGDNRAMVIEITTSSLLRSSTIPLLPSKMKCLISSNLQSVQKHFNFCHEGVKEYKIISKFQALTSNWNDLPQDERSVDLNSIEHQLQIVMTNAEKKCRKLRT